jgi:hypothetical protein
VRDWAFTGVPNPLDITGGQRSTVFTSKMPNRRDELHPLLTGSD